MTADLLSKIEMPVMTNAQNKSPRPDLVDIAEGVLNDALSDIMDDHSLTDRIWEQFTNILNIYKNAVAASINDAIKGEMYQQVLSDEYSNLKEKAVDHVLNSASTANEISDIRSEVEERLYKQLRPIVIEKLKAELLADPDFIVEVKNDLKRTILSLS